MSIDTTPHVTPKQAIRIEALDQAQQCLNYTDDRSLSATAVTTLLKEAARIEDYINGAGAKEAV
jgi:hypothetical protein